MTDLLIALLFGFTAGLLINKYLSRRMRAMRVPDAADTNKILGLFNTKKKIRNDDVEKLLGVSDATATRYLDRLEKRGLLVQRGKNKGTYYTKNT